jgi:hypothetical protein
VINGTLSLTHQEVRFDSSERDLKIRLDAIRAIFFRRHLLVDSAIEIFTTYAKAYFINFDGHDRSDFLVKLGREKLPNAKFCQKKPDDVKRLAEKASVNWRQGKLSNFDYLMKLNIYAGRSYNDLCQYPVFPWILANYNSASLDLTNPQEFRDLSQPIGALNQERLAVLKSRLDPDFGADSLYLYGALYSSAAVVIGYLVRLEPFTGLHVQLQSGQFDHPDRLFDSLIHTWQSVRNTQMDFRELIPEFFTLPRFLINENHLNLGKLMDGKTVDDIILPKWAPSARHFIEKHREALESQYVSTHLHEWIDLIFGPRSRPPLAQTCDNQFHPWFYDTALTPEVLENPQMVSVVREYAACFGMIPLQLFDSTPPARTDFSIRFPVALNMSPASNLAGGPIVHLSVDGHTVSVITSNFTFAVLQSGSEILRGRLDLIIPKNLPIVIQAALAASRRFAAIGLPWSSHFALVNLKNGPCAPSADCDLHTLPITAIGIAGTRLVSAGKDCCLRLWEITEGSAPCQVRFLAVHSQPMVLLQVSDRLKCAVAIAADGFLMAMSIIDAKYLGGVHLGMSNPSHLLISRAGYTAVCFNGPDSHHVKVFDQNLITVAEATFDGCVQCWAAAERGGLDHLFIALDSGRMAVLRLPCIEEVLAEFAIAFVPAQLAYVRREGLFYAADAAGGLHTFKCE